MQLLHIKKMILEIKQKIAELDIEQFDLVLNQKFEDACDIKAKKNELLNFLKEQRMQIVETVSKYPAITQSMEYLNVYHSIIFELSEDQELLEEYRTINSKNF